MWGRKKTISFYIEIVFSGGLEGGGEEREETRCDLPTEDTKDQVHDKKCSQNHHRYKVYKLPPVSHGIMNLPVVNK